MANTTLTQTGAQVQSILNKADKLPATVGTNGQVLTSDGTNLSWQTPQGGGYQASFVKNYTTGSGTGIWYFNYAYGVQETKQLVSGNFNNIAMMSRQSIVNGYYEEIEPDNKLIPIIGIDLENGSLIKVMTATRVTNGVVYILRGSATINRYRQG